MNPPNIDDAQTADMAIEMWEGKLVKLDVEYGETFVQQDEGGGPLQHVT